MARKPPITDEERELFREAVGPVVPVASDRAHQPPPGPPPIPRQRLADEARLRDDMLSDEYLPELETGDELWFARPGLQHSLLRKLRRGQYSVAAELDLHGMTVVEARQAIVQFLQRVRRRERRCVRIIHGKGNRSQNREPVLKHMVNRWLRQRDEVLAFSSARPVDGGTGAVYVLLKRG